VRRSGNERTLEAMEEEEEEEEEEELPEGAKAVRKTEKQR
jgi:hypothetical protein